MDLAGVVRRIFDFVGFQHVVSDHRGKNDSHGHGLRGICRGRCGGNGADGDLCLSRSGELLAGVFPADVDRVDRGAQSGEPLNAWARSAGARSARLSSRWVSSKAGRPLLIVLPDGGVRSARVPILLLNGLRMLDVLQKLERWGAVVLLSLAWMLPASVAQAQRDTTSADEVTAGAVNQRSLPPSPYVAPVLEERVERIGRDRSVALALESNLRVKDAEHAVARARYEQLRAMGRNDGQFSTELNASRGETPMNSGISRGLSRSDVLRLNTQLLRRFDTGTMLALTMENGLTRSEFPFYLDGVLADRIVSGPDYMNTLTASITQSLLAGRSRAAAQSADVAAELQLQAAQARLRQAKEQVVHDVVQAYTQLLVAETTYYLQQRNLRRTLRQVDAAEARVRAGQLAPFERNLVLQRMSANQESVLIAHQDLRRNARRFMQQMQITEHHRLWLTVEGEALARQTEEDWGVPELDEAIENQERRSAEAWCEYAMHHSPEVAQAHQQVALAQSRLRPAEENKRSTLDLSFGVTSMGLDPDFLKSLEDMATLNALTVFGSLKFALQFRNRLAHGEYGAAESDLARARVAEQSIREALCFAVVDAFETVELQRQRRALSAWRIQIAYEGLEAEEARFERGLSTVTHILDALENVEATELELLRVEAEQSQAWWTLRQQVGGLGDVVAEGVSAPIRMGRENP